VTGWLNLPKGSDNYRFSGGETQIDSPSEQHTLNPTITAPHLLRLSAMRARLTSQVEEHKQEQERTQPKLQMYD
jgi:hypothetical protein